LSVTKDRRRKVEVIDSKYCVDIISFSLIASKIHTWVSRLVQNGKPHCGKYHQNFERTQPFQCSFGRSHYTSISIASTNLRFSSHRSRSVALHLSGLLARYDLGAKPLELVVPQECLERFPLPCGFQRSVT
jgi:hypothetical protein